MSTTALWNDEHENANQKKYLNLFWKIYNKHLTFSLVCVEISCCSSQSLSCLSVISNIVAINPSVLCKYIHKTKQINSFNYWETTNMSNTCICKTAPKKKPQHDYLALFFFRYLSEHCDWFDGRFAHAVSMVVLIYNG